MISGLVILCLWLFIFFLLLSFKFQQQTDTQVLNPINLFSSTLTIEQHVLDTNAGKQAATDV
jgi:hypothetical protein